MNISSKFLDIKTSTTVDRSEKKPEADQDSVKDFLLGSDKPTRPEPYGSTRLRDEVANQGFRDALSITPTETPLPPQENIASTDFFTASISEHLITEATPLQTAPLTAPIDVDETSLPARAIGANGSANGSVPSAEILPASSQIASTETVIDFGPAATNIEYVEGKASAHAYTGIDGKTVVPAKDTLILETPLHGSNSVGLVADVAKDQTLSAASTTVKDTAPKLDNAQHKVMTENATPKEGRQAAPLSGDTPDQVTTAKAETIALPVEKLVQAAEASSDIIAKALSGDTPDQVTTAKAETIALPVEKLVQAVEASSDIIAKALTPETPKLLWTSPELSAEEIVTPKRAAIKETSLSPPISKYAEIAHNHVADAAKFTGDVTPPLTPIGNPISDNAMKAPQAVTIITAPTSTSHPALQTVAQTLIKAQETQSGISVRLDPPEMGRVFIDFKFEADRSVTAIIRSEIAETAILLKDKAEFFQQTLKESGFDSINLSFEQNDQSKQKAFGHDDTHKAPTFFQAEQSDDAALQTAPPPSHKYKLSTDTAIDIKL